MLAAIYNEAGKVIAEAEAVLDADTGRPARALWLPRRDGTGDACGALIGVSGGLARYIEAVAPEGDGEGAGSGLGEAQAPPAPRTRRARKAAGDE